MKVFVQILLSVCCAFILCCEGRSVSKEQSERVQQNLTETRVIGGANAPEGSRPYLVSIQTIFGEHICGGTIIATEWILTAGHCMEWQKQYLKVVTGTINWAKPNAEYLLRDVRVHCLHNKPMYHNDIALIRLNRPIVYNELTQPINLAFKNILKEGDKLTLSGWGSIKVWGRVPQYLQTVELSYMDHVRCEENVRIPEWLGEGHICTDSSSGQGPCHGDSGGPLVDENNVLVGVVNWGEPCAIGRPDIFASAAYYFNWIHEVLDGSSTC